MGKLRVRAHLKSCGGEHGQTASSAAKNLESGMTLTAEWADRTMTQQAMFCIHYLCMKKYPRIDRLYSVKNAATYKTDLPQDLAVVC